MLTVYRDGLSGTIAIFFGRSRRLRLAVVDEPNDAIKTRVATIWVENGILVSRSTGVRAAYEDVLEANAVYSDLTKESPLPALFDARKWPGPSGSVQALQATVENMAACFTAIAWLHEPELPPDTARIREVADRLLFPYRLFTDEAEALEFLSKIRA